MTEARVIKAYRSAYPDPLILKEGDKVRIEERPTEWSGWLWGIDGSGKGGWIPERYLVRDKDTGILNRDYNAAELTVSEGDIFELLETESGWARCRNSSGKKGWLPVDNIEILS